MSAEAVRLLLEVSELSSPILSNAAIQLAPHVADELIAHGLLVHHDFEGVTVSTADHDDAPVSLQWSDHIGALSYFDGSSGPVTVEKDSLRRWRVEMDSLLGAVTAALNLQPSDRPFALVDGQLWEVGSARLDSRRQRTPIWFARRLWDAEARAHVQNAARLRPHLHQRVLLTSSRSDRVRDFSVPGFVTVSLTDVLAQPTSLAVDAGILSARLTQAPVAEGAGAIALSPDGRQLRINGNDPIGFRSQNQITAIRRLIAAHRAGERVRVAELTDLGSLNRLFGAKKWAKLALYLKSVDGLWAFEP